QGEAGRPPSQARPQAPARLPRRPAAPARPVRRPPEPPLRAGTCRAPPPLAPRRAGSCGTPRAPPGAPPAGCPGRGRPSPRPRCTGRARGCRTVGAWRPPRSAEPWTRVAPARRSPRRAGRRQAPAPAPGPGPGPGPRPPARLCSPSGAGGRTKRILCLRRGPPARPPRPAPPPPARARGPTRRGGGAQSRGGGRASPAHWPRCAPAAPPAAPGAGRGRGARPEVGDRGGGGARASEPAGEGPRPRTRAPSRLPRPRPRPAPAPGRAPEAARPSPEPARRGPPTAPGPARAASRRRGGRRPRGGPAMALDFLAGCAGGVAGVLVGHPFDTVKVRLQVQSAEKPQYRGTLHCFQSIIKQESVLGLYKGLGSPLLGLTFINALVFGVQGNTLRALGRDSPLNQFVAGAAAGAIQCVICCPMELAKTRLQLQDAGAARAYRGSLHCLAHIYRREGLRGVNRGMASTLLRETPSFGVYFLSYDVLTRALGCEPGAPLLVPKLLLAGGTSGILSWLSTYPVDVVKSRLQADGLRGAPRYGGIADCARQSYRAEGWRVFTRGLASTLLRAFPVNAATFATVTVVLSYARGPEGAPAARGLAQPSSL
uniref:Mitochondrial basic amino acids transporter n=1 Tax=Canis lupus familiaris TaxID=9615 RepID=A0A8I3MX32_CANLF